MDNWNFDVGHAPLNANTGIPLIIMYIKKVLDRKYIQVSCGYNLGTQWIDINDHSTDIEVVAYQELPSGMSFVELREYLRRK